MGSGKARLGPDDGEGGALQPRAAARVAVWAAADAPETTILDTDAALVEVHSDNKEQAASHYKGGYGFHPMFCFADHSGEALAGILRPGNAGANSGVDQLTVVDAAIASLPEARRMGHCPGDDPALVSHPMVVRADSAGAVKAFIDGLVARNIEFSVYARVSDTLSAAIYKVPESAWRKAILPDGEQRHAGELVEPHQGAQLRLWDINGSRHQVTLTNSAGGPLYPDAFTHAAERFARQVGIPGARLHDARHGYATQLLERGVHPGIACAVLGHASPAFTMATQHVVDGMAERAAEAIEEAHWGSP